MDVIVFNVKELNQLVKKQLQNIEDINTLHDVIEWWYISKLYEFNSVLFSYNPKHQCKYEVIDIDNYMQPFHTSLLFKLVRISPRFYETQVRRIKLSDTNLILFFEKGRKISCME